MALKEALKNAKGIDIKVYDVRGESSLADYFVVATGAAAPHLKALVAAAQAAMKAKGVMSYRVSGESDSGWVVADCSGRAGVTRLTFITILMPLSTQSSLPASAVFSAAAHSSGE